MRRLLCSCLLALGLAGCATTGYFQEEGAADYYYERDYQPGYYAGYGVGYGVGHVGFYDPFWAPGFHFGLSSWPYYGYGYGYSPYYAGWPYAYAPWYDSWWGVGYNDWSWQRHQQALTQERVQRVQGETAAVAAMRGNAPQRTGAVASTPGVRYAPEADTAPGQRRWNSSDATRQLRTDRVDNYYGTPRQRRGEGLPQRSQPQLGVRDTPSTLMPSRDASAFPRATDRPHRGGPAFRSGGSPDAPSPMRAAPSPMRTAPSMDRAPTPAPSFAPRPAASPAPMMRSGDGGGRRNDRR